jgi:hypothetical protein
MKASTKIAIIFYAVLTLTSCGKDDSPATPPEPSTPDNVFTPGTGAGTYISEFVYNNTTTIGRDISLGFANWITYPTVKDTTYFDSGIVGNWGRSMRVTSIDINVDYGMFFNVLLSGDRSIPTASDSTEYKRLITELRDTTCPFERGDGMTHVPSGKYPSSYAEFPGIVSILNPITDLEITSNPQYTQSIPADKPITELFAVLFNDVNATIWNGYVQPDNTYWSFVTYAGRHAHTEVPAYYTRVAATDKAAYCNKPYIGQDMFLKLLAVPDDNSKEYTLTFKFTFADGTVNSVQYGPVIIYG